MNHYASEEEGLLPKRKLKKKRKKLSPNSHAESSAKLSIGGSYYHRHCHACVDKNKIKKPPVFSLKDLPKYSKTLKGKVAYRLTTSVLKGKHKEKKASKAPDSPKARHNIEWTKTPVYKQFALKLTETESLSDSVLGLRNAKRQGKGLDISNPGVKRRLLEQILQNIYGESEIEYTIKLVKSKGN